MGNLCAKKGNVEDDPSEITWRKANASYGLDLPVATFIEPCEKGALLDVTVRVGDIETQQKVFDDQPAVLLKMKLHEQDPERVAPPGCASLMFSGTEIANEESYGMHGLRPDAVMSLESTIGIRVSLIVDGSPVTRVVWPEETVGCMLTRTAAGNLRYSCTLITSSDPLEVAHLKSCLIHWSWVLW